MRKPTKSQILAARKRSERYERKGGLPPKGESFLLFKKVRRSQKGVFRRVSTGKFAILTLYVPANAQRVRGIDEGENNKKARVSLAYVVSVKTEEQKRCREKIYLPYYNDSNYGKGYWWKLNRWHRPKEAFSPRRVVCASGLHGFLHKRDAEEYNG